MGQHRFIPRKPRGRALVVAAGVLSVTAGLGVAAYAKQAPGGADSTSAAARCTLKPNPDQSDLSESRSCFTVDASLDRAPAVGETATIRFTVTAERAAKNVRVEADLPAGMAWASLPAGLTQTTVADPAPVTGGTLHRAVTDHAFKAGEVRTYEGRVTAIAPGSTEIRVRAGTGSESIGEDAVFLTMAPSSEASAFGIAAAAAASGTTTATLPSPYGSVPRKKVPADTASAGPNDDAPWSAEAKAAAGSACVTGRWAYVDDTGATRLVDNATVEVWDVDTDSAHDRLAVGTTGSTGEYRLCFPNTDAGGQDVYLKFISENTRYRVQKTGTPQPYVFTSRTIGSTVKGSTSDFGPLKPADPAMMRAWAAFNAANDLWRWVPGAKCWDTDDAVCRKHILNWTPGGSSGTYYRGDINETFLNGIEPKAPFIVVHEMGHALMDDLYEDVPPPLDCASPHYLHRPSGRTCAWVEGFAHWAAVSALSDPWVRWPVGAPSSLETANRDWDNGETVEGRVAGALLDISDYLNDGSDTYGEGSPAYIWKTVAKHKPKTFREFWDARRIDGYNVASPGALKCLWQNTIMY